MVEPLKRYQAKWAPVRRPEARQDKDWKRRADPIRERAAVNRFRS